MVVMNTLDEIIAALDDDDENVAEMIVEQGRTHARFSDDFDEQTFWVKKTVAVNTDIKNAQKKNLKTFEKEKTWQILQHASE